MFWDNFLLSALIIFSSLMIHDILTWMRTFSRILGLIIWSSLITLFSDFHLHLFFFLNSRLKGSGNSPNKSPTASNASRGPQPSLCRPIKRWKKLITLASCRLPRASTRGQTVLTLARHVRVIQWKTLRSDFRERAGSAHEDVERQLRNFV